MKVEHDLSSPQHYYDVLKSLADERWSCRAFIDRPVERSAIDSIIELARQSPSWCNTQPWQLLVTEGAETKRFAAALHEHAVTSTSPIEPDFAFPRKYAGSYDLRRREVGGQLYHSLGIEPADRVAAQLAMQENFRLFGAPHLVIVSSDRDLGVYGAVDCGIFAAHFMLAVQSLGLASIPQASLAAYPAFIRNWFGLSDDRHILFGLSFGWADTAQPVNQFRTTRASVADIVDFRS